ncbi:MAG: hypothetical protein IJM88_07950 [Bacteroidales bacterium]|nr:hypothetical protein [Bacteroidales bacterium]
MNIIDLAWCVFYRYDEKHNTCPPIIGATIAVAFILELYILAIITLLNTFAVDSLPHIDKRQYFIIFAVFLAVVYLPFRTKEIRDRKLTKFNDYKKAHPRKHLWRFWLFVSLSIGVIVASILVMNTIYEG